MKEVYQGDILHIEGINGDVFVASKNFFNKTGLVVGCPLLKKAEPGPLHIQVRGKSKEGFVICEQFKSIDLRMRGYSKMDETQTSDIMEVSDTIQGLFDYIF